MDFVIEHLSKSFEKKEVLKDINFTFEEGKIYGLLGRKMFEAMTILFCLLYCVVAFVIVYRIAPKTFKLRQ